jgi:hypothetical protein
VHALAGCTGVFVGFESLNEETSPMRGRRHRRLLIMRDRMRILRHDGIQTVRSYLGFVHDRKDAFFRMQGSNHRSQLSPPPLDR